MLHRRRRGRSALLVLSAALAAAALFLPAMLSAQTPDLTVQVTGMTGEDWPQGQAFVTVLGADGRPLPGLTVDDVRASMNGAGVPVGSVAQGVNSDAPIDVVLALDVSNSMNDGGAIDQAKAAAHTFIDQLAPQDRIAIVAFGTRVQTALPFTQDRAAANAAIDALVAEGSTALFQGTVDSIRLAASGESGRRAVVLLSDGLDFGSSIPLEEAIATGQTSGVPVFAIGLGEELDRAYLGELADVTGGRFAETPSPEGLAALYQQAGELLRGQYIITTDASGLDIERSQPIDLQIDVSKDGLAGSDARAVCAQSVCIAISGVEDGVQIEGRQQIEARVVAAEPVTSVVLAVDGQTIVTLVSPPYAFTLDSASLGDGEHNVTVEAKTASSNATTADLTVRVGAAASGGGVSGLLPAVALGGGAVLAVLAVWFVLRRRRGRRQAPSLPLPPEPEPPTSAPEPSDPTPVTRAGRLWPDEPAAAAPGSVQLELGALVAMEGEMKGQSWSIGAAPISIGTGHRCLIRVPQVGIDDIANEHARIWVREDHLVVHELRRLTALGPTGGRWEFLNAGDSFSVGPNVFIFQLTEQADAGEGAAEEHATPEIWPGHGSRPAEQEAAPVARSDAAAPAVADVAEPDAPAKAEPLPADPPPAVALPPSLEPAPFAASRPTEGQEPAAADVPNILREHNADEPAKAPPPAAEPESGVPNVLRDKPAQSDSDAPPERTGEDAA